MSCREHGKGWGTRPAITDGAGPGGGRGGGEVGGFWVHLKEKLTKFASRLDVGGPGRLRKKPTALRYHRSRKDRRDMARKQQTTSQVRAHRQLMGPTVGPVNVSLRIRHPTQPPKANREPHQASLDRALGARALKVTRF